MKYFIAWQKRVWPKVKGKKLYLLFDYDGTLTPIAQNPGLAVLSPQTRAVLKKLSDHPRCVLAIISGRSLADIKKMVKIPRIIYAGNHGFEVDYKGVNLKLFKDTHFAVLMKKIYIDLRRKMKGIKGVLLENKKMTISVHYRLVAKSRQPELKTIFNKVLTPYQAQQQVTVTTGKMVLEIRPPVEWGKGELVSWLLDDVAMDKNDSAVFYFGDDHTDEDAFKVLKGKGFAVIVGKNKQSAAEFYLRNTDEVKKVLEDLWHNLGAGK